MATRWIMLSILFIARTAMAFQYQAAAALSPLVVEHYGVDLVDIGFLIGLYMGPGALIALPGGGLAARFGDRRIMLVSLGLMLAAGPVMSLPALVLEPHNRALGMGVFFSIYYAAMLLIPMLAGWLSDVSGSVASAFWLGAVMMVISVGLLVVFGRELRRLRVSHDG